MSCLLPSFLIPQLTTPLPGLKFNVQGEAEIIAQLFTCCEGGGFHYHRSQGAYSRCPLVSRLKRVNRWCQVFKKKWGFALNEKKANLLNPNDDFLPWLLKFRQEPHPKGRVFSSLTAGDQPSFGLWLMALMTIWRTGLDVHIVSLGRSGDGELLPDASFATETPGIVFIEHKAPFWQPRVAFDFDVIINWCEGAAIPLWVDICQDGSAVERNSVEDECELELGWAFAKKLAKSKRRPPLAWLGSECCSRLRNLCVNSEQFMEI